MQEEYGYREHIILCESSPNEIRNMWKCLLYRGGSIEISSLFEGLEGKFLVDDSQLPLKTFDRIWNKVFYKHKDKILRGHVFWCDDTHLDSIKIRYEEKY